MKNKFNFLAFLLVSLWLACSASASETVNDKSDAGTESGSSAAGATEQNAEQFAAVMAINGDAEYGAYLGGECLTCHSPDGGDGSIPLIHGKDKSFLASALLEYKNKQRDSEVMRGVSAALNDEEIAALVTYFSEQ